jgi:hypothetical protein
MRFITPDWVRKKFRQPVMYDSLCMNGGEYHSYKNQYPSRTNLNSRQNEKKVCRIEREFYIQVLN